MGEMFLGLACRAFRGLGFAAQKPVRTGRAEACIQFLQAFLLIKKNSSGIFQFLILGTLTFL